LGKQACFLLCGGLGVNITNCHVLGCTARAQFWLAGCGLCREHSHQAMERAHAQGRLLMHMPLEQVILVLNDLGRPADRRTTRDLSRRASTRHAGRLTSQP